MQDDITMPPKHQLKWLIIVHGILRTNARHGISRSPQVIAGHEVMYYKLHSWFWNVGTQRPANDNGWWMGS